MSATTNKVEVTNTGTTSGGNLVSHAFEDYTTAAQHYDVIRRPVGLDVVQREVEAYAQRANKNVSDLRVLDAGCGSGLFIPVLVDLGIHDIQGIEINPSMLQTAQKKFEGNNHVTLQRGSLFEIPFDENSFDMVFINQVLHHLDTDETRKNGFTNLKKALGEVHRILKPGGALLVNFSTPHQCSLDGGYWYIRLFPHNIFDDVLVTETWMAETFASLGFKNVAYDMIPQSLVRDENYLDPEGPLKDEFRRGDSSWALLSSDVLSGIENKWKKLVSDGKARDEMLRLDENRQTVGQSYTIRGFK